MTQKIITQKEIIHHMLNVGFIEQEILCYEKPYFRMFVLDTFDQSLWVLTSKYGFEVKIIDDAPNSTGKHSFQSMEKPLGIWYGYYYQESEIYLHQIMMDLIDSLLVNLTVDKAFRRHIGKNDEAIYMLERWFDNEARYAELSIPQYVPDINCLAKWEDY